MSFTDETPEYQACMKFLEARSPKKREKLTDEFYLSNFVRRQPKQDGEFFSSKKSKAGKKRTTSQPTKHHNKKEHEKLEDDNNNEESGEPKN